MFDIGLLKSQINKELSLSIKKNHKKRAELILIQLFRKNEKLIIR